MKEHRITALVRDFFFPSAQRSEEKPAREVPVLSERQVAYHRATRESGRFTVEAATKLYQKSKAR